MGCDRNQAMTHRRDEDEIDVESEGEVDVGRVDTNAPADVVSGGMSVSGGTVMLCISLTASYILRQYSGN